MDDKQSDENSEKIKEINEKVKYPIRELEDLLYEEMAKNAQKKVNLPEIEEIIAVIDLFCGKSGNKSIWCGHYINVNVYSKDKGIRCLSNAAYLPDRVKCTDYSKIDFELYGPSQSAPFVQKIEDLTRDIYDALNPKILTHLDKQHIHIRLIYSIDPKKTPKENPEISRDFYEFRYNDDRSNVKMEWDFYDPHKLLKKDEDQEIYNNNKII